MWRELLRARRPTAALYGVIALAAVSGLSGAFAAGCTGTSGTGAATNDPVAAPAKPTLRLYLLNNVAGALEPCGCSKDQLGGASHFAAFITGEREKVKDSLLLGAGPLFFQDPTLTGDKTQQSKWKAEALADAAAKLPIAAWAPGNNDFAAGLPAFEGLAKTANTAFLSANVSGSSALAPSKLVDVAGIKVGLVGVAELKQDGLTTSPAAAAITKEAAALRAQGARLVIGLATMPRGDALRVVDDAKDLDVLVIGKPTEKGDLNDQPKPATLVGGTLVVETSNHLQTVAVLDVFVNEPAGATGRIQLSDGGGLARAEQLIELSQRVRDLENRINGWEKDKNVSPADLSERKKDLARVKQEKSQLESTVDPTPVQSYFKYSLVEVRDKLGEDPTMQGVVLGYYKRVNDHNREAFKGRTPPEPEKGAASYIGVDKCSTCHAEERAVWDKTDHAKAYPTLEAKFVEFNLDCVSCHVTGYEKPGGSTVTQVETLKNVQCEVCHGPGSLHAEAPKEKGRIVVKPEPRTCVAECHHPPHVEGFDAASKIGLILGPGHGK